MTVFSKDHLLKMRHELRVSQQRLVAKRRQLSQKLATASRAYYGRAATQNVGDLASYFGKKLQTVNDGHMYLKIGGRSKRGKKGKGQTVYHGTAARNAKSIISGGLRVNGGKSSPANGAAYGRGIYTSPQINIPFSYAGQQALNANGKSWLCIFECKASAGRTVSPGIFLVPDNRDIEVIGLHLYRT